MKLERVTGFEPVLSAWKADALPVELYPQYEGKGRIASALSFASCQQRAAAYDSGQLNPAFSKLV